MGGRCTRCAVGVAEGEGFGIGLPAVGKSAEMSGCGWAQFPVATDALRQRMPATV